MKSRLFVVDDISYVNTVNSGIASINVPPLGTNNQPGQRSQWVRTIADMMADMLQIEIGDYIFLWQKTSNFHKNRIFGVYRAVSKPYFDNSNPADIAPFKIHIEQAYVFDNPIDEYDVLNCPYANLRSFWAIMGKKIRGKPRGTSPLSLDESKYLITFLIGINPDYTFIPWDPGREIQVGARALRVDYQRRGNNPASCTLANLNPNAMPFIDLNNNVLYEKVLETVLNQEIADGNNSLFAQIGIDLDKVVWYCNYLPYSLEQSEMDYVVIESDDGINFSKIFVIELIKERLDKDHIQKAAKYSKWVNEMLSLGMNITQPIIICFDSYDFINPTNPNNHFFTTMNAFIENTENTIGIKPIQIYTYDFLTGGPRFTRKK